MGSRGSGRGPLRRVLLPLRRFAVIAREVALRPAAFFRKMPEDLGVPAALVYAASCAAISTLLTEMSALASGSEDWAGPGGTLETLGLGGALWLAFAVSLTGVLHLLVRLLAGRGRRGSGTTLKIVGYGSTAQLGSWIPYLGWLFDLYFFYLLMLGVREAHRTSEDRALAISLIPLLLVFLGLVAVSLAGIRGVM